MLSFKQVKIKPGEKIFTLSSDLKGLDSEVFNHCVNKAENNLSNQCSLSFLWYCTTALREEDILGTYF